MGTGQEAKCILSAAWQNFGTWQLNSPPAAETRSKKNGTPQAKGIALEHVPANRRQGHLESQAK